MRRMWWIILLVAAGIGLAILVGVLGERGSSNSETKTEARLDALRQPQRPRDVDPDARQHRHVDGDEVGVPG